MNVERMILLIRIFLSLLAIIFLGYALYNRFQVKKTFDLLNQMLDEAIKGEFKEKQYNESQMSKLEIKFKRYLTSSMMSWKNILKEKETMKGLISDISHQTRTPITNILLYSQLLSETDNIKEDSKAELEQIMKQSNKLEFLIQSLVKLSRLETGIIEITPTDANLNYPVAAALEEIQLKATKKNITIRYNISECIDAYIDEKWTTEAIYNVLDNAVKYTGEAGTVTISLQAYELFIRLDITDTGMGIREEEINQIFHRFYRSKDAAANEGVGIGLYLTRQILHEEGGYIKVSSKYGEGTTFSLFFPVAVKEGNLSKL